MKLLIRYAKPKDAPMLSLLSKILFYEKYEYLFEDKASVTAYCDSEFSVEKMKLQLNEKSNMFFLVQDGVLPIGYVELETDPSSNIKSSDFIIFQEIYLFREYLNKGLDKLSVVKLLQESIQRNKGQGTYSVDIES